MGGSVMVREGGFLGLGRGLGGVRRGSGAVGGNWD